MTRGGVLGLRYTVLDLSQDESWSYDVVWSSVTSGVCIVTVALGRLASLIGGNPSVMPDKLESFIGGNPSVDLDISKVLDRVNDFVGADLAGTVGNLGTVVGNLGTVGHDVGGNDGLAFGDGILLSDVSVGKSDVGKLDSGNVSGNKS